MSDQQDPPPVDPGEAAVPAARGRNRASEIIVEGHIWSAVWYVAWPTAISTLIQTAYGVINAVFVGRLSNATDALAAVGIANAALMVQFGIVIALSAGTTALVSRFIGAEEYSNADESTGQSIVLSVAGGILTALPLVALPEAVVTAVGAKGAVIPLAADYLAIISWFSIPLFILVIITSVLRSTGDVRNPLWAGAAMILMNILFDWLLIFGVGPLPAMGVRGAAVATAITRVLGMVLLLAILGRSTLKQSLKHVRPHWGWCARILNIGWPAGLQNLLWSLASVAFVKILSLLPGGQGTAAQAAFTVAIRIESFAFMPGLAYSIAATPLVGQNIGAGKPDRAARAAWVATGQAVFIMTAVALVFILAPRRLALMFTDEPAVVPLIVSYLIINAFSEPLLAVNMVMRGALQGAGETRAPAIMTVATFWIIRIPLAYVLAITLGHGAAGAWIAMSATTGLSGILMAIWFRWGTWRTVRV